MKQIYYWYSKKSLDWWSVPHFLFGVVMALAAPVFLWPIVWTFVATVVIAFLWEGFERRIRLHEARANSKMDILLPLLAFILTIFLMNHTPTQTTEDRQLFLIIALSLHGFLVSSGLFSCTIATELALFDNGVFR
jgi:dolichyl-phosphate-mannose--protein O-mannosyl transferase